MDGSWEPISKVKLESPSVLPLSWTPVRTYLIIFYKESQQDGQWGKGLAANPSALEMVKYVSQKLENFRSITYLENPTQKEYL